MAKECDVSSTCKHYDFPPRCPLSFANICRDKIARDKIARDKIARDKIARDKIVRELVKSLV